MVQTAEPWHRYDPAANAELSCYLTTSRCSLRQRKVRPVFMVIADVLAEQSFQMPLIEYDHMVQNFLTAAAHPTLGHVVLPGTAKAGSLGLDAECNIRSVLHGDRPNCGTIYLPDSKADRYFGEAHLHLSAQHLQKVANPIEGLKLSSVDESSRLYHRPRS